MNTSTQRVARFGLLTALALVLGLLDRAIPLTALLGGEDFRTYRSAIVQGIKRSGKTSLLNYLREYIRTKKNSRTK